MGRPKGSKNKIPYNFTKEQDYNFFTEFECYFKDDNKAEVTKKLSEKFGSLKLTEHKLFNRTKRYNAKYSYLDQLTQMITSGYLNCDNPHQFGGSPIRENMDGCSKSTLNNFLTNDNIDWRSVNGYIFKKIWREFQKINEVEAREEEEDQKLKSQSLSQPKTQEGASGGYTVFIVDDTDLKHSGKKLERQGKVFSHTEHKMIYGHKLLLSTIYNKKSSLVYDFAIVGEKGKNGNQGLTEEQQSKRFSKKREDGCSMQKRIEEHENTKMQLAGEMAERAANERIDYSHFLCDSWFGCPKMILRVRGLGKHFLGMTKKSKTKYNYRNGDQTESLSATALIERFGKSKDLKYDRSLKYHYFEVPLFITNDKGEDVPIKMFFVKGGKRKDFSILVTTDISLDFRKVVEIYSYRWTIEVTIRDLKQHLGLTKCQARNFTSHIAHVSICVIRYNLMSLAMRTEHYKTLGGLFRDVQQDCMELTVIQKFRILFLEMIAHLQNFLDPEAIENFINSLREVNSKFIFLIDYNYRYKEIS